MNGVKEGAVETGDRLLTPGEVAALFRVDPKTVTRWAAAGRISSIRTPGGHRRFPQAEGPAPLAGGGAPGEAGAHNKRHGPAYATPPGPPPEREGPASDASRHLP